MAFRLASGSSQILYSQTGGHPHVSAPASSDRTTGPELGLAWQSRIAIFCSPRANLPLPWAVSAGHAHHGGPRRSEAGDSCLDGEPDLCGAFVALKAESDCWKTSRRDVEATP